MATKLITYKGHNMNKAGEFRKTVIKAVLEKMGAWSESAEELLLGTALQESLFLQYRKQIWATHLKV